MFFTSVNNFHAVLLWLIVLLLKVLERQKLLETADGMGGQTGSNRQADQKVVIYISKTTVSWTN